MALLWPVREPQLLTFIPHRIHVHMNFVGSFYLYTTEAEKGQSKNILQIQKNILNRNIFLKSLSKSLTNLKNYCKS